MHRGFEVYFIGAGEQADQGVVRRGMISSIQRQLAVEVRQVNDGLQVTVGQYLLGQ